MKHALIIGNNWPEPSSTAAGMRMMQLIKLLQKSVEKITFCCAAPRSDRSVDLSAINVNTSLIQLNHPSFNNYLNEIQPDIVVYDRFYIEEQYGWRVQEVCPDAITILDTEDLHFLRKTREKAVKKSLSWSNALLLNEHTYREIGAMRRCDLSLIISDFEMQLLIDQQFLKNNKLLYLPFLHDQQENMVKQPVFDQTADFMTIGNFMHAPNEDGALQLKTKIWPEIRRQLPKAQLHIYGSYCQQKHFQWHNAKQGFLVHGSIEHASGAFDHKRVLLAPLRFGAGLKGKIFDAMNYGVPVCTSEIGAEGMYGDLRPNGLIALNDIDFIEKALQLYTDQKVWEQSQYNGIVVLKERFEISAFAKAFQEKITSITLEKKEAKSSFESKLLNYHSFRHQKFKSRWIEVKEKTRKPEK